MTIEEVDCYVNFFQRHCANFMSANTLPKQQLFHQFNTGDFNASMFLSPPVQCCMTCERNLTMHNPPSRARLYSLEGPLLVSKITLECKQCQTKYGITRYTSCEGSHYYPREIAVDVVEVSNTTYFTNSLYRWIPSLR